MKRCFLAVFLLVLVMLGTTGCTSFTLIGGGDKAEDCQGGDLFWGSCYDYWWGESPEEAFLASQQEDRASARPIYQVSVTTNYVYQIISVVSLGTCVPVEVHWWPVAPDKQEYTGVLRQKRSREE